MNKNIAELIKAHAQASPEKCAITDGEVKISYNVLESASNRFCRYLVELGCRRGDRVVLLAERKAILLVGILGILKSGGIYIPLDPRTPSLRLQYVIGDTSPSVILVEKSLLPIIHEVKVGAAKVILTEELQSFISGAEMEIEPVSVNALPKIHGDDIAYCIYTSGSTGYPKGVLIKHQSIIDFFEGAREFYDVDETSRCISFSPFTFDAFVIDILLPLYYGAWVYWYNNVVTPDLLFEAIKSNSITHLAAFGAMFKLIAEASTFDSTNLTNLKTILTGADVPDPRIVQKWLRLNEGVKVINGYGPTEATCACAAYVIRDIDPDRRELYPIGKAFKHVNLYLVSSDGKIICDPNIRGKLLVGGSQVMQGYWHQAEESELRLVEFHGSICYKTGDICEYLPDGNLLFIGRDDDEVNISGYRVNLNEIKLSIKSIREVEDSEVFMINSKYEEKILVAAVVFSNSFNASQNGKLNFIRKRLLSELPRYMMPRRVVAMHTFPRMTSGKVDRGRLLSVLKEGLTE